jgi:hypothetical protein
MGMMNCGRFQVSGFGINGFEPMDSFIRKLVYFATTSKIHEIAFPSEISS